MARSKPPTKPHKRQTGQFVGLPYYMLRSPQYRALSADARAVLIDMHLGFHGHNNGAIGYSLRQAMECLHSGSERAKRAIDQLQSSKFIVCRRASSFNLKTKRAREWEITFQPLPNGRPSHAWNKQNTAPG